MDATILPEEILSMICADLGREADFNTLFNCALSSKSLADSALRTMYRYHDVSPAFNFTEDDVRNEGGTFQDGQRFFRQWAMLWRSIICSSLEPPATYKPYCRYLRILDFRNLSDMLQSTHFRNPLTRSFYAKPLTEFNYPRQIGMYNAIDVVATINGVGETVVPKATMLEEISGHLRPGFLTRWVAQTPRLKTMSLWSGDALGNGAGKAVSSHCEYFDSLQIHGWLDSSADQVFSDFLDDLNSDTIQSLHLLSFNNICRKSFESLGRQYTLRELVLNNLSREAMENLNGLKSCTELEILSLEDSNGSVRLEELNADVFQEVISWLSSCKKLRELALRHFFDGPAILAAVAIVPEVRWHKLTLDGYTVRNHHSASFHTALSEQKSLQELSLSGSGEDTHSADLEIMVSSICQLSDLHVLILKEVSEEFDMTHISQLVLELSQLEKFSTWGQELTSDILPLLANLRNLRDLTLFAMTQFDFQSLFDFIGLLDPVKQKGFSLSLMAVDMEFALDNTATGLISDRIKACVEGSFEQIPYREAESEHSDSD